ncbi:MAG: DUF1987 domain-containing protein [Helicobacteraceae bacterium]|nr:DUF1987 domain-containing protein [Helicobacteraceae bacterium]
MQNLNIEATKYTPKIDFNFETNSLKIVGKSTPENTFEFFEPIKSWLGEYFTEPKEAIVTFNVPYFNSSSSRAIYDVFDILSDAHGEGSKLTVNWEYNENNENAEESGEEFQEDFEELSINLVVVNT